MSKIIYGDELLKAYRGNILVSATKTDITIEKDGETYSAGTRNLPIGTYTVTATPRGTAELTSLEVNGNSFVSGSTIDIGFGGNLNVVAVSEGGGIDDLSNTKWTYTVRDDLNIPSIEPYKRYTLPVKYSYYSSGTLKEYDYLSTPKSVTFEGGSRDERFYIDDSSHVGYFVMYYSGACKAGKTASMRVVDLGSVFTLEFGEISGTVDQSILIDFLSTYFTQVTT